MADPDAEAEATASEPIWIVTLRAKLGHLARSKRLRIRRTDLTEDSDAATLTPLAASNWEDFFGEGAFSLGCGVMIAVLVLVVLALIPLVLWLSSRGRFIFLDNVIHDGIAIRGLIVTPRGAVWAGQ